jgi:HlyD family secretion protein
VRRLWAWRWRLLGLGLLLAVAAYAAVPRLLGPIVPVETVARGTLVQSVVATGRVRSPHRVSIGTQIAGIVARIPVAEGETVRAGALLIALETSELRAALDQAQAAVAQAEARLRQLREVALPTAEQSLRQAEANLRNAQQQHARVERLHAAGAATLAQHDEARRALDVAEAQAQAARLQVASNRPGGTEHEVAGTALQQARATLRVALARLDYASITAPVDGTLIGRAVEPGDAVQPGRTLMVLSPTGPTEVVVQVDERNLGLIAPGQPALVSADAFPERRFAAELSWINPAVDPQRASVEVRLRVPEPPAELRQDMTVSVDIAVAERPGALILPATALLDTDAEPAVLRLEDGRVRRQPVRLGLRGLHGAEVLEGLAEGDRVVPAATAAAARLRDGARVRVRAP